MQEGAVAKGKSPHPRFADLLPFASQTGEGEVSKASPSPAQNAWERVPYRAGEGPFTPFFAAAARRPNHPWSEYP
jgi:hypothetical protein